MPFDNNNNKNSFQIQERRKYALSMDTNDQFSRLQILDEDEVYNTQNANAFLYLNKAISINEESKNSPSINQMKVYLVNKGRNIL